MSTDSKKKTYLTGAGLVVAGVAAGAMFAPVGLAGAQETDGDTTDDTQDSAPAENERRHGRFGGHRGEVLEELGIDRDALEAGRDADQTLVEIAEANGVSEAELVAALQAEKTERLAEAVENGRITQERADEISAGLDEKIDQAINTRPSERPEREGRRGGHRGFRLDALEELGLTGEEIRAGFEAGQTLAETAEANGISEDELVDALVAAAMERADAAVESGRVTQEQVDEHLADIEERITERVNTEPGEREGRRGGFRRGPGARFQADGETEGASITT